MPAETLQLLSL